MTTSLRASAGTPCRIRKGTSVGQLPSSLGFRRAAILGLAEIEMFDAAGAAVAMQQLEQPGGTGQTLRSADQGAATPPCQVGQCGRRCVSHDPVRTRCLGDETV